MDRDRDLTLAFASRLRAERARLDIPARDLAAAAGVHINSLGAYERGIRTPNAIALARLARRLNCSTDWLLGLEGYE